MCLNGQRLVDDTACSRPPTPFSPAFPSCELHNITLGELRPCDITFYGTPCTSNDVSVVPGILIVPSQANKRFMGGPVTNRILLQVHRASPERNSVLPGRRGDSHVVSRVG